jgi:hypothetical protein
MGPPSVRRGVTTYGGCCCLSENPGVSVERLSGEKAAEKENAAAFREERSLFLQIDYCTEAILEVNFLRVKEKLIIPIPTQHAVVNHQNLRETPGFSPGDMRRLPHRGNSSWCVAPLLLHRLQINYYTFEQS